MAWYEDKAKDITELAQKTAAGITSAFNAAAIPVRRTDIDADIIISFDSPLDGTPVNLTISTHYIDSIDGGAMGAETRINGYGLNGYTVHGQPDGGKNAEFGDAFDHTAGACQKIMEKFNAETLLAAETTVKNIHSGLGIKTEQPALIHTTMRKRA